MVGSCQDLIRILPQSWQDFLPGILWEGKTVGPYSIPIKLLKMISHPISLPLCLIVNESFTAEIFPDKVKLAKVITLYKQGSRDNPTNYCPISLLSILVK